MNKAEKQNKILQQTNSSIYDLLSKKGREITFPSTGIPMQAKQAKGKQINATIGIALEEDETPIILRSVQKNILLSAFDTVVYAPNSGKSKLRKKWKDLMVQKNPSLSGIKTSAPIVVNALTHGLSVVAHLFLDEKDEIIIPDLFWGNYKLLFENAKGAKIKTYNLFSECGFDVESFKQAISGASQKTIVLFNFPNNPTGYTPTKQEAEKIIEVLLSHAQKGNKILAICDDAYFGLVYEEEILEESIFAKLANLHENVLAVKIDGATKEDYAWGLRCGFITYAKKGIMPEELEILEDKTTATIRGSISNVSHASQSLILQAYNSSEYYSEKKEKYELLKKRYSTVNKILKEKKYEKFNSLPCNSGYFICIQLHCELNNERVRQILLNKYSTGVVALKQNILRIAFSSVPTNKIEQLFDNINDACKDYLQSKDI